MTTIEYGAVPELIQRYDLDREFTEYMHWMYLPVRMPNAHHEFDFRLPPSLLFTVPMLVNAIATEVSRGNKWDYVYLTARRGYATPGNPLNRPGWHSDGFGTDDINYVWTDRFPTLFAVGRFLDISDDHIVSAQQFEQQIANNTALIRVMNHVEPWLMRLTPEVIHRAPDIEAPGGERSFLKVSFSNDRYALRGNSHNHLFDYHWDMASREAVRNDPGRAGKDAP